MIMVVMKIQVVSFQAEGTRLEVFLHKNQHNQRKLLNFENWTNGDTMVFCYEISKKYSVSNLNYSPIGPSISFKIVEIVRNILNSFA